MNESIKWFDNEKKTVWAIRNENMKNTVFHDKN